MSAPAIFALAACALCLLLACFGALAVGLRALRVAKRARELQSHPTLVAARKAPEIFARLDGTKDGFASAGERLRATGESIAKILSSLALFDLNVDRVAFATKLFLSTFVPTLAGLMSDH